jgi:hypothetical protein
MSEPTRSAQRVGAGRVVGCVIGLLVCLAAGPVRAVGSAQEPSSLAAILAAVGAYVDQYEHDISAIVAEEEYLQVVQQGGGGLSAGGPTLTRRLKSDLLVMDLGAAGWASFRDVYEVDGEPVRDREERLAKLFLEPPEDPAAQLRQIATESARFNLNPEGTGVSRTVNTPMTALSFLRSANQSRSAFRLDGTDRVGDRTCTRLAFLEQATPRIIASDNAAPSRGSACVDPGSGRVLRTKFNIRSVVITRGGWEQEVSADITVIYDEVPRLSLWLPVSMDEFYNFLPGSARINGHAEYSAFRQFQVDTGSEVR